MEQRLEAKVNEKNGTAEEMARLEKVSRMARQVVNASANATKLLVCGVGLYSLKMLALNNDALTNLGLSDLTTAQACFSPLLKFANLCH
jgi:phosphoheptose isomerase